MAHYLQCEQVLPVRESAVLQFCNSLCNSVYRYYLDFNNIEIWYLSRVFGASNDFVLIKIIYRKCKTTKFPASTCALWYTRVESNIETTHLSLVPITVLSVNNIFK